MNSKKTHSVVVISQYYYPDIATTGQLLSELSGGLAENGLDVHVVTAFPTYDSRIMSISHEVYQGVSIRRIWSTKFNKNTNFGKILNSLTFFISAFLYIIVSRVPGILLIVSNPPFLPFIGHILSILQKRKYIYLVHDVYPDIAVRLGYLIPNSLTVKLWGHINTMIINSASAVIVLSDAMKKIIGEKVPDAKRNEALQKIKIIHNWADGNVIKPIDRKTNEFVSKNGLQDKFVVLYSGNMGLFHELEMVIEAARTIEDSSVQFLFIGDGGKKKILEQLVRKYGLSNVSFLPYQPKADLPLSLTSGHIALVTLEENIEGLAMPSKLYSIMAAGNSIIAICDDDSDVAKIIKEARCGFSIRHQDTKRMTECIDQLKNDPHVLNEMGSNARKYFEQHFTLNAAVHRYKDIIDSVM